MKYLFESRRKSFESFEYLQMGNSNKVKFLLKQFVVNIKTGYFWDFIFFFVHAV